MRHNILIVDDEQLIRQGLRARIEYLGIDVDEIFEAENGLMALRLQEEHPIDVVITDIRMPKVLRGGSLGSKLTLAIRN